MVEQERSIKERKEIEIERRKERKEKKKKRKEQKERKIK